MTVGHIYGIRDPDGREIYVGSTTKTDTLRWGQWKAAAKTGDWLACPMLRYAKERWGDLDACSYHVLTTVELPGDVAVAKQILRRLEAAFIESALAREEPLQNNNEPICKCEKTRRYQAEWRARHPDYMRQKGREWRARRKRQREAIERQAVGNQQYCR
eukprot:COSAG02_NODE_11252_length_1759_cov_20.305167_2_plen_159_part_00